MAWNREMREWYRGLPYEARMRLIITVGGILLLLLLGVFSGLARLMSCTGGLI